MKRILFAAIALGALACKSGPSTTAVTTEPTGEPEPVAQPQPEPQPEQPMQPAPHEALLLDCMNEINVARGFINQLEAAEGPRTLDNTVTLYDRAWLHNENAWGYGLLYGRVHPDPLMREAAEKCEVEAQKFASEVAVDRGVYDAFVGLADVEADEVTRRLIDYTVRDFRIAGVDKDDATRAKLRELDEQLMVLGQEFQKNIAADTKTVKVEAAKLAGMPEDWMATHPADEDGFVAVSTNEADYLPIMSYADDPEVRRQVYVARQSRAASTNEEVLRKILALRAEKATMLGFANWADYVTADKMMKSGDAAAKFIARVTKLSAKRAKRDYNELLKRKRKDDKKVKVVEVYDKRYYENKLSKEKYDVDPTVVRKYFEYGRTEAALLALTSQIYDVEYVPVSQQEAGAWHPTVKSFDVKQGGKVIGRIHLDMHPRPDKYTHYAMFPIKAGVAGVQLPEAALVCNFPEPKDGAPPALMEQRHVETMFHEFGHLVHWIIGGHGPYARYAGTQVERDFVEAPSQMFEEWATSYETLSQFAVHVDTGETIPKELVDKMRTASELGRGSDTAQQMLYAALSLELHRVDPDGLDFGKVVRELDAKHTPFPFVEGTAFHTSFGHLQGYSAMYYTYMWSKVLATDILSPFKKHGLLNKEWTLAYRDKVLAVGGHKDAEDLLADFLGRPWSFAAFEKWLSK